MTMSRSERPQSRAARTVRAAYVRQVAQLVAAGLPLLKIAEQIGRSTYFVLRIIRENNLAYPRKALGKGRSPVTLPPTPWGDIAVNDRHETAPKQTGMVSRQNRVESVIEAIRAEHDRQTRDEA